MIELQRNTHFSGTPRELLKIKLIGIGGAGANALDRVMLDGAEALDLTVMNSDAQALTASVVSEKVQIGRNVTRGLGAGGDPEIGMAAADEALEEIQKSVRGAKVVFLCAGLGGGTGSGAAPVVAGVAREEGALVIALVTMPFAFEGKRRSRQAEDALHLLQQSADVVICFENDRMGDAVAPTAGVQQAFASADLTISQSIRAIVSLLQRDGIIHIGFDDLLTALRNENARCLFGYGEAEGDNRAHEALARALKNALMDRGRLLEEARNVLVNVAGGPNMTLNEVQILMEELGRHIGDETQILFGTAVDAKLGNRMTVTLISSLGSPEPEIPREAVSFANRRPVEIAPEPIAAAVEPDAPIAQDDSELAVSEPWEETEPLPEAEDFPRETEREELPAPVAQEAGATAVSESFEEREESWRLKLQTRRTLTSPGSSRLARQQTAAPPITPTASGIAKSPLQATLQFESATRGRFEKCEPTIEDGEDLDVPTFMRKNIRVK